MRTTQMKNTIRKLLLTVGTARVIKYLTGVVFVVYADQKTRGAAGAFFARAVDERRRVINRQRRNLAAICAAHQMFATALWLNSRAAASEAHTK